MAQSQAMAHPMRAAWLQPGHRVWVLPGDGSDTQHCCSSSLPARSGKVLACLFLTERVLQQQKTPRRLCFSAALLMTRWPPVNTKRSKGGYKGHVRRTQLPGLQRETQKHCQIMA